MSVKGAKIKSFALHHGQLVVTLRHAVTNLTVTIHAQALTESANLKRQAQHHRARGLKLTVTIVGASGGRTAVTQQLGS